MMWKSVSFVACAALVLFLAGAAFAEFDKPVIKRWTQMEKNNRGEEKEVHYMTIDGVMVHETDPAKQPAPPVVTPGATDAQPPSDAVVLFDGKDLSNWVAEDGQPTKWILRDGAMIPTKDSGMIRTRQEFGSCQLHIEWAAPERVSGEGQGRGNSGVFLMGQYEIQVLDSYENATYPDGQAGALYGRAIPLVNACRKPGEWQTYDIVFHRPVFENGEVVKRATFTVLHNGVLIHDNVELSGGTGWLGPHAVTDYVPHGDKGPLMLQDHGNPVAFRNIWIRELKD
jgi:hypothetical protein